MITPEEFYSKFDSRTKLCTPSLHFESSRCVVRLISNPASYENQLTFATICNLLSRWCREVYVDLPDRLTSHPELINGNACFRDGVLAQMREVNPFAAFAVGDHSAAIEIVVGAGCRASPNTIRVSGAGWFAAINTELPEPALLMAGQNPFGPIAAACLAVAEAFRLSEKPASQPSSALLDLFTLAVCAGRELPHYPQIASSHVGNILMVGAGAVASATAFCLKHLNPTGSLTCLDFDTVKIENLNRSPLLKLSDVGKSKTAVIAEAFAGFELDVKPLNEDWEVFIKREQRTRLTFDCWLPLANERNVRWSIQSNFPPEMIHASTSPNWIVNFGRHIPFTDDCLVDRFPEQESKPVFACSGGMVDTPNGQVDAALPFLSTFAGLLVAADLVRRTVKDYPQTDNFAEFGFRNGFRLQTRQRIARKNCICQALPKTVWANLVSKNSA